MKIRRYILVALFLATSVAAFAFWKERDDGQLKVFFLDIGQGDSIYIRTPNGHDMLIDGGPSGTVLRRLSEAMPWYDRSIDVVVETHPDADHIGGLPDVLSRYTVGVFVEPGIESKNAVDDEIRRLREVKGVDRVIARRGQAIDFGDGSYFKILFPDTDVSGFEDTNDASIVGQMTFGSTSVMLTGDSPKKIEDRLVINDGTDLRSDILKAGHHGSKTSSGEDFVRLVAPEFAVISSGAGNRYGHPSKEAVSLFERLGIPMLRTDREGTIGFVSDGAIFRRK